MLGPSNGEAPNGVVAKSKSKLLLMCGDMKGGVAGRLSNVGERVWYADKFGHWFTCEVLLMAPGTGDASCRCSPYWCVGALNMGAAGTAADVVRDISRTVFTSSLDANCGIRIEVPPSMPADRASWSSIWLSNSEKLSILRKSDNEPSVVRGV